MSHHAVSTHLPTVAYGLALLGGLASCTAEDELDPFGESLGEASLRQATIAADDPLAQSVLDSIDALLPESQDATQAHPELFPTGFDPNPQVVEPDTEVWVTFVQEGASYHSAMGYFTYPVASPPTSLTQQELEDGLIFADASGTGPGLSGGGSLHNGVTMSLGTFQPGVRIGFYLVRNGACDDPGVGTCSSVGVDFTRPIYTTVDSLNPEYATDPSLARHVVMAGLLDDPSSDARLLSFEDQDRLGSTDDDFNDVVFRVTASPELAGDDPTIPPGFDCSPFPTAESLGSSNGVDLCMLITNGSQPNHAVCFPDGQRRDSHVEGPLNTGGFNPDLADLDGDGDLDFVSTRGTNSDLRVLAYESDGQGGFVPGRMQANSFVTAGGWGPYTPDYGDIDGDGDDDLCMMYGGPGTIHARCFDSDGDGSFTDQGYSHVASGGDFSAYNRRALADIDGDGDADMCLVRMDSQGMWSLCYEANGQGQFLPGRMTTDTLVNPGHYSNYALHFGDVDGDGLADLCALYGGQGNGSYTILSDCFLGDGTGAFPTRRLDLLAEGNAWAGYSRTRLVDIDLDGDDDMCVMRQTNSDLGVACFEADGSGNHVPDFGCNDRFITPGGWTPYRGGFGNM